MLTFVPPDPIIVYPKSCLYPSLHIRRPFPSSSSSYPPHIPQAYPKCILEKQLGGSSLFQTAGPEVRRTSSRQGRKASRRALSGGQKARQLLCRLREKLQHTNLSEGDSVHLIPTKLNHRNARTILPCSVTLTRFALATSDGRSTQLLTERHFPQPFRDVTVRSTKDEI
jgi:hypothetical protein